MCLNELNELKKHTRHNGVSFSDYRWTRDQNIALQSLLRDHWSLRDRFFHERHDTARVAHQEESTLRQELSSTTLESSDWLRLAPDDHPLLDDLTRIVLQYEGNIGGKKDSIGYDYGGGINSGANPRELRFVFRGWSRNIPRGWAEPFVRRMLQIRLATAIDTCRSLGIDFQTLPKSAQLVIADMHYNLKPQSISKFTKFWSAIRGQDWKEAGRQLLVGSNGGTSAYLRGTGRRAYANAQMLSRQSTDSTSYLAVADSLRSDRRALLNTFLS